MPRPASEPRGSGRSEAGRKAGWGLFKCRTEFVGRKTEEVRSLWLCWSVFELQQPEPAWKNPPGRRSCLQPAWRTGNN